MPRSPPRLALAALLFLLAPSFGAFAQPDAGGHWEILGEDGAIWVPANPPAVTALPPPGLGAFHDHAELTAALQALAATYPSLASLESLGDSVEGRDVWALTLRAGADDGRPAVLFDGAHHGDEVIASEILYRYAEALLAGYPGSARSRDILEGTTVVLVPMVNPDGVARAHTATDYAIARKNAHGVDLNRNYAGTWGGPGSSGTPSSATYRGPSPASEPETQAMQALLASRNWTFYSSLHSGAELILWPLGHTTQPPAEEALYTRLGNELTARTQVPNGQVSEILYQVSGDSMDHAYLAAGPYWKPIATSPETFEGSGNAFDWWPLFNPTDAQIPSVVDLWTPFLDHLAREASHYAPPALAPPPAHVGGGAPFSLATSLTTPLKRPLLSGDATLTAPAFLDVLSANPVPIGAFNGTKPLSWSLSPTSGGLGVASLRVGAGVAGNLSATTSVEITAPAIHLALDRTVVGSGEVVQATIRATSDTPLTGTARLEFDGALVATRGIVLSGSNDTEWVVPIEVGDAPVGARVVRATMEYVAAGEPGVVSAARSVTIDRPQLQVTRTLPAEASPGSAFVMSVVVRNVGTMPARDVTIEEIIPAGYALWPRAVGVPVPLDPIVKPEPAGYAVGESGGIAITWTLPALAVGGALPIQIGLMPILPGEHVFHTTLDYAAQYTSGTYLYDESAEATQTVALV